MQELMNLGKCIEHIIKKLLAKFLMPGDGSLFDGHSSRMTKDRSR